MDIKNIKLDIFQIGLGISMIIQFVNGITNGLDIRPFVRDGHMLDGHQFWSSRVKDTVECARMCLRRRHCVSFNYETQHGRCELNSEVSQDGLPLTTRRHVVYSSISEWPSQIDAHCHHRPCQDDETCIPGGLVDGTCCSYACFKLYKRCTAPEGLVTHAPRTANTVMDATCKAGYKGGVTATCLESLEWNTPVDVTCIPRCEDGWILFENHCYHFGGHDVLYTEARVMCVTYGSTLVQIDSVAERDFLKQTMMALPPPTNGYWNDLYEVTTNGAERWRTTNDPLDPNDWGKGNPDDTYGVKQKCTMFFAAVDYMWIDLECEENAARAGRPLCKKPSM